MYTVKGYLNKKYYHLMESECFSDIGEAESFAWECVNHGYYTTIESSDSIKSYSPDLLDAAIDLSDVEIGAWKMDFIWLVIGIIVTVVAAIIDFFDNSGGSGLLM